MIPRRCASSRTSQICVAMSDCLRRRKTAFACECLRKRLTFDKLHHDEVTTVRQVSGVEDHRRVRMAQLRHRARFAQETIGDVGITGKFAPDDLDGDRTFETEVRGKVNRSHAAGPDFAFYSESASDKLGDIHIDLPSGKRSQRSSVFGLVRGKRRRLV